MKILVWVLVLLVGVGGQIGLGQAGVGPPVVKTFAGPTRGHWGDQGDGTYANPIVPGDFSDLDAIRVGKDFYAMSSTFYYSPGVVILHSRDLVNWEIAGHVVEDVAKIDPEMNWDRMNRRGRGIWAGSIRFHAGKFWVYFGTPDQGFYMSTAANAAGPWAPVKEVFAAQGWDDPCPFRDDDGQEYFVASHTAAEAGGVKYNIHLWKMNAAGDGLVAGSDRVIHQSRGSEANKLYKIKGVYFHYYSEVKPEGRVIMMERAKSLEGPWEIRQLNHVHGAVDKEPNQGGLIELEDGRWWFVSHQGKGDWEGRAGVLLPVTWVDGWPVIGEVGADGIGNMVWRGKKPIEAGGKTKLWAGDGFDGEKLRPEWEWNYQPRVGKWSLTARKGFLRMEAFPALKAGDFTTTGDVLTQRAMRSAGARVTVKMDVAGMTAGQEAGLAHYAKTYCTVGVLGKRLELNVNGVRTAGPAVAGKDVWLRSEWGFAGVSHFSYSTDGKVFTRVGEDCQLTWGSYRGDRVGLFTVGNGGYVDWDEFGYEVER